MQSIGLKELLIRVFFILLSLFIINRLFFFSPSVAESTTSFILYPLLKIQKICADPIRRYYTQKYDKEFLQQELMEVQAKNEDLLAQIIAMKSLINFENSSREVREFAQKYNFSEQKLVQVLMRSFDEAGHFFWVDAGAKQGIHVNMIALYKNNIVGRVMYVDHLYSKIALITDQRCKIAASCATTQTVGIYEGHNSFVSTLEFVPHYEKIVENDIIVSTGQGLVYPQGFGIGKIRSFHVHDATYKIMVEPLLDLQNLEYVYLVAL